jgi:hypothetical protein
MTTLLAGWKKYRTIVIDHTNVDADLSAYPILLPLSAAGGIGGVDLTSIFTELGVNQLKLAIADNAGAEGYVEEVSWDSGTPFAEIWTAFNISSAADTTIVIYYDATQADNSTYVGITGSVSGKAVWDANFVGVWHMNDANSGTDNAHIDDSTGLQAHSAKAAANQPVALAASGIGTAQNFDGTDDIVTVDDSASLSALGPLTLEYYFNQDVQELIGILTKANASNLFEWQYAILATGVQRLIYYDDNNNAVGYLLAQGSTDISDTNYHYIAASWNGINAISNIILYSDGTVDALGDNTKTGDGAQPHDTSVSVVIGGYNRPAYYTFDGKISETRISNIARSDPWIHFTDSVLTDNAVTFGAEKIVTKGDWFKKLIAGGML